MFYCLRQSKSWRRIIISSWAQLWFTKEKQGPGPLKRKQTDAGRECYANSQDDNDCLDGDNDDWICDELETVSNGREGGA